MNDDSDLEHRLRRLLPAAVPGELQHKLHAAEPARTASRRLRLPALLKRFSVVVGDSLFCHPETSATRGRTFRPAAATRRWSRRYEQLRNAVAASLRPWPLAYAALGAAWAAILVLHLFTPAPPPTVSYSSVARASDGTTNPAPVTLTAGFSADRALFLTRNDNPDSLWR